MPEKLEPRPNEDYFNYFAGLAYQLILGKKTGKFESLPEIISKDEDSAETKDKIKKANEIIGKINELAGAYIMAKGEKTNPEEIFELCGQTLDILYVDGEERKKRLKEKFEEHQKLFKF